MKVKFGIDIGGTSVKIGYFEAEGRLIEKYEIPTDKREHGKYILDSIKEKIMEILEKDGRTVSECAGVGIGLPGPVDEDGNILGCVNLGWGTFAVERTFSEMLSMPVRAANDANAAALGECLCGAGRGRKNMVMVTLGTGVGGGVILDGRIVTGSNGGAGEIGHFPVNREETEKCSCGKCGCLEQYASATGVVRMASKIGEKKNRRFAQNLTAKDVFDLAKAGDDIAAEAVHLLGEYLGMALAATACLFNPQCFVIGGGVSAAGEILLREIHTAFDKYVFAPCKNVDFVLAELGNDAGIYGAGSLF